MAATHVAKEVRTVPVPGIRTFKVHHVMCTELMKLVDRVSSVFPEIEAARSRCSTGIQALGMLHRAIEKANLLLQYCSESSKLYLAVTGDVIVSRFSKARSLLEQSLDQIQFMVPVALAVEISQLIDDLSAATFVLDPHEEEAGKIIRELLQKGSSVSDSLENSEVKAFQLATSRLQIMSSTSVLIEKRAIKKLLDRISENDVTKKKILTYFLYLFRKYGKLIVPDQTDSSPACYQGSSFLSSGYGSANNRSCEMEPRIRYKQYDIQSNMSRRAVPPEEFRCPISSRLMYDPVVTASGQTYERMWIQRWFDEGHDRCPKTNIKLSHMSLTPNIDMKESISKWCVQNGVVVSDPRMETESLHSWDNSSTSTASLGSWTNDLRLPMDFSNISLGSLDTSFSSDCSLTKGDFGLSLVQTDNSSDRFQSNADIAETDLEFLSKLRELSWESQCKVVEDVNNHLKYNDKARHSLSSENFVEPLVSFLRDARDFNDIKAQRDGFQLLLTFVKENRIGVLFLHEDAFGLLASFLDSEVTAEAFTILEILSGYPSCGPKIAESGALAFVLRALDSQTGDFREQALNILCNLSSNHEISSQIACLECIPKLVFLFCHNTSVGKCLLVMKNLCNSEKTRAAIAENTECLSSLVEVLECGSSKEQEHAVDILISLCTLRVEYCQLLMDEGVIPVLVSISIVGSGRGKASALELLRLLRDARYEPDCTAIDLDAARGSSNQNNEKN